MTTPNLSAQPSNLTVRPCTSLAELDECVRIQQKVWKFSDFETVPSDVFIVALKTGGQVIGAFDGDRQIGFTLAFMAAHDREIYLHSHFAAVLPEFQGSGIGRLLKLAQREDALKHGIRLIEWTFDPLALMNAHFNLNRLGAIIRRYIPNFYGVTSSPLHGNIPTDRLVAEWWLDSDRVTRRVRGEEDSPEPEKVEIGLPRNTTDLLRSGSPEAGEIQSRIRGEFMARFADGYSAVGVEFKDTQASYILSKIRDNRVKSAYP
jgi:predicted GNAT superfamily acetyltransferase